MGPGLADFLLLPEERLLPPAGKIGVVLDNDSEQVIVAACMEQGACATTDIKRGDVITRLDNAAIKDAADLRLALWGKKPGDIVNVEITRRRVLLPDQSLSFELTLK